MRIMAPVFQMLALLLVMLTGPALAGGNDHDHCAVTPDSLQLPDYQHATSMSDQTGFHQQVFRGISSAFSVTDFLAPDADGDDRTQVIESVARQLAKLATDGKVQQVNPERVAGLGLDLVALLYSPSMTDGVPSLEAGAVVLRDGCYSVLRFTRTRLQDRNSALDSYLGLIRAWHAASGGA